MTCNWFTKTEFGTFYDALPSDPGLNLLMSSNTLLESCTLMYNVSDNEDGHSSGEDNTLIGQLSSLAIENPAGSEEMQPLKNNESEIDKGINTELKECF